MSFVFQLQRDIVGHRIVVFEHETAVRLVLGGSRFDVDRRLRVSSTNRIFVSGIIRSCASHHSTARC